MKKYWQILKKYKISLLACPLLVLVSVMCETVQPMYMADIIDNGVMQRDLSVITAVGGKMILISIVGLIFSIANVYVSSHRPFRQDTATLFLRHRPVQYGFAYYPPDQ